jgi:hypothetical protein
MRRVLVRIAVEGHHVRPLRGRLRHVGRLTGPAEVELLLRQPQLAVDRCQVARLDDHHAATRRAALTGARRRGVPALLSRHVIAQTDFVPVAVEGLAFPRSFVLVTPAYGEPSPDVWKLSGLIRDHIRIWLR